MSPLHAAMCELENQAPPGALQEFRDAIVAIEGLAGDVLALVAKTQARLPELNAVRKRPGSMTWEAACLAEFITETMMDHFDLTPEACAVLSAALMKDPQ